LAAPQSAKPAFRAKQSAFRSLAELTSAAKSVLEQDDKQDGRGCSARRKKEMEMINEYGFEHASAATQIRAITVTWSGGDLETLVGGLHYLARRAGSDRAPLVKERPHAQR
jgi:hypothetical protein